MKKTVAILFQTIPIIIMIGLIPFISSDLVLTGLYVAIIICALIIKREQGDFTMLLLGFLVMIVCEYFFVTTGVETFTRNSLFNTMPLWLPFLWAYGFVVMKRGIKILGY